MMQHMTASECLREAQEPSIVHCEDLNLLIGYLLLLISGGDDCGFISSIPTR